MRSEVEIGPLLISPPLALAPMTGLTHSGFRRAIRALGGCGLVFTEMINAAAFAPRALQSHRMLDFQPDEHPIAVQVAGHDPERMAWAAAVGEEHGVDIIDINAGCPVRQVTGNGAGAALLRDLGRLAAILRAVRRAVSVPVTLKFRSGWDEGSIVAREVAVLAESCGCAAITLHPRTRAQGYAGRADWTLLAQVVQAVTIPVWASGDIRSVEDARRCFEETGCAGLMIGRGALANPWLLAQIAAVLAGKSPPQVGPAERYRFLTHYIALLRREMPHETAVLGKVKALVGYMHLGLPGATVLRQQVMRSHSLDQVCALLADYFSPWSEHEADSTAERGSP